MIIDMSYWTRVLRRVIYVVLILLRLFFAFKLSIFYMPFLIAFIISLMIEPAIRFFMKKLKFTRKTSSIIIFVIVSGIIIGGLIWGIISLISEASNLLKDLNTYVEKIYMLFQSFVNKFDFDIENIDDDMVEFLTDVFTNYSNYSTSALINLTHKDGSPWDKVYIQDKNKIIPIKLIKDYFSSLPKLKTAQDDINALPEIGYINDEGYTVLPIFQ